MRSTYKPTGIGRFGSWLADKLEENNLSCGDFAKTLKCSRTIIESHIRELSKPAFVYILAYCQFLGGNPWEVWGMAEQDWEGLGKKRMQKSNLWFKKEDSK